MSNVHDDLKRSVRGLLHAPGFSAACVLILALGLASAVSMFSVLKAVVLDALPYPQAERLMVVDGYNTALAADGGLSTAEAQTIAAGTRSLAAFAFHNWSGVTLTPAQGPPREVTVLGVSEQFFAAVGSTPILGRALDASHYASATNLAVLSHREWMRMFAGAADAVGKTFATAYGEFEVVGVMPADFDYPSTDVGMWLPLSSRDAVGEDSPLWTQGRFLSGIARLAPQANRAEAQAELDKIAVDILSARGEPDAQWRPRLTPIVDRLLGDTRWVLWGCFAIALLVLGIACINVGLLMHARVVQRQRVHALVQALGASRARVLRVIVMELCVLALLGALVGTAVAQAGLQLVGDALAQALPRGESLDIDSGVMLAALLLTLAAVVLAALLGARVQARPDAALSAGARVLAARSRALRVGPMVGVAMSTVALVAAGAIALSLYSLHGITPGYRYHDAHAVQLFRDGEMDEWRRFGASVLERLRAEPGIDAAALTTAAPLSVIGSWEIDLQLPDRPQAENYQATLRRVAPGYLDTLEIPLLRGRDIGIDDRADSAPVAIINQSLARASFGDADPIGRRVGLPIGSGPRIQFTVVGVMADIRNSGPRALPQPEILVPFAQSPWQGMTFLARSALPPAQALAAIERAIHAEAPDEAFTRTFSLGDELAQQTRTTALFGQLLGAFAACALLLAGFGVYALAAFVQRQRVPEFALRLALGARPDVLLRGVFAASLRIAGIGILLGAAAAWAALAVLRSQLFGFGNELVWAYLLAIAAVAAATMLASWLPARRAAAVDPAVSLRGE